jgi:hypothetical protein
MHATDGSGMNRIEAQLTVARGTRLTRLNGALAVAAACPKCGRELVGTLDPRPILAVCRCGARVELDPIEVQPTAT